MDDRTDVERVRRCLELAREAGRRGEAPVGSLVVKEGRLVAEAGEAVESSLDVAAHAEIVAIRRACAALGTLDLGGCVIYTTAEPCVMCSFAIRQSRFGRVVVRAAIPDLGGITSRFPVLTATGMPDWPPPPAIAQGILGAECAALFEVGAEPGSRPRPSNGGEGVSDPVAGGAGDPPTDRAQIRPSGLDLAAADRLAYAYGVRTGDVVWIAGQVARDGAGRLVGEGDAEAQAVQCFENVRAVVEAAGGTMDDLVRVNMYVTERPYRDVVNAVRARYFSAPRLPVGTLLIVAGLALPEYLVEVDAVAVLGR